MHHIMSPIRACFKLAPASYASTMILHNPSIIKVFERMTFFSLVDSPAQLAMSQITWSIICKSLPFRILLMWSTRLYSAPKIYMISDSSPKPIFVRIQVASSFRYRTNGLWFSASERTWLNTWRIFVSAKMPLMSGGVLGFAISCLIFVSTASCSAILTPG